MWQVNFQNSYLYYVPVGEYKVNFVSINLVACARKKVHKFSSLFTLQDFCAGCWDSAVMHLSIISNGVCTLRLKPRTIQSFRIPIHPNTYCTWFFQSETERISFEMHHHSELYVDHWSIKNKIILYSLVKPPPPSHWIWTPFRYPCSY